MLEVDLVRNGQKGALSSIFVDEHFHGGFLFSFYTPFSKRIAEFSQPRFTLSAEHSYILHAAHYLW